MLAVGLGIFAAHPKMNGGIFFPRSKNFSGQSIVVYFGGSKIIGKFEPSHNYFI